MIVSLIMSLFLTIVIELGIAFLMGIRSVDDKKVVVLVNICTNPVVVYIANCVRLLERKWLYNSVVTILEILAVLVEFQLYKKYLKKYKKSPFILSVVCNGLSFFVGVVINYVF